MCKSRNFLDWISDLEDVNVSTHLMSIAVANDVVIEHVQEYAAREIANSSARKNENLSMTLTLPYNSYCSTNVISGKQYLNQSS